jgi:hypothetical protein
VTDHARVRYLESKRSVDDRALSRRVSAELRDRLPPSPTVFEAGPGTGVTVPRLLSWGVESGRYRGVERSAALVAYSRTERATELAAAGRDVSRTETGFRVADLDVSFVAGDATKAVRNGDSAPDLVVAQAFMDLVPVEETVALFEDALSPGGLAYFPITFDGGTVFQPDHPDDDAVEAAYHRAIDADPGRDSRAGRHLLDCLRRGDGDLLAVDASDWVVHPHDGVYPADEAHFLDCILGFVDDALSASDVDARDWLATRRAQLDAGELSYVAHGYDLLYRVGGNETGTAQPSDR